MAEKWNYREAIEEIALYFAEGFKRERYYFFSKSVDAVSDKLRASYLNEIRRSKDFNEEKSLTRPRTYDLIEAVKFHCMTDSRDFYNGNGFVFEKNETGINDPNKIVERTIKSFKEMGFGYLIDEME